MISRTVALLALALIPALTVAADAPPTAPIRVLVWDEQQPAQKQAYGDKFLGQNLADALAKNPALKVTTAAMPAKGQTDNDPALATEGLAHGKPSHVTTLLPDHPIAKGVPANWDVSQTEMYDEPFNVPAPDAVIFEEKWDAGERFRAGCLWSVGQGHAFYFRPGHETYPAFREGVPPRVIENAARYFGARVRKQP